MVTKRIEVIKMRIVEEEREFLTRSGIEIMALKYANKESPGRIQIVTNATVPMSASVTWDLIRALMAAFDFVIGRPTAKLEELLFEIEEILEPPAPEKGEEPEPAPE